MDRWFLVKDIFLTGTGMVLVLSQVFADNPSDVILAAGLALTVPSVAGHAKMLLTGSGDGPFSPPSPPSGPSHSGSLPEAEGGSTGG